MGVVHGLEGDSGVVAIEVAVLHEVFNSIDNLELSAYIDRQSGGGATFLSRLACSSRASSTDIKR